VDQIALVTEQVADGRKLIERLAQEGIEVSAAGWLRSEYDAGQWFFYIATPIEDTDTMNSYRRLVAVVRTMPTPFWIDPMEIKLISPKNPIAKWMRGLHDKYPTKDVLHLMGGIGAPDDVEEAFVYPMTDLMANA
jgi:hypothetical protein